jgi:hypothetical protein
MKNALLQVSIRHGAVFIPAEMLAKQPRLTDSTAVLVKNVAELGYSFSEPLLHALNGIAIEPKVAIFDVLKDITGLNKNWAPLVQGWDTPTNESTFDHLMVFFATILKAKGTQLTCGHTIPSGSFDLQRYNGCPFCGTLFEKGDIEVLGQGSKTKVLELWTEKDLNILFESLLTSKTALDATQMDSLKVLLLHLSLPEGIKIEIKETLMAVIDACVQKNEHQRVQAFFTSPTDILRYLWYKKTGFLQVIEPKTIVKRTARNSQHFHPVLDRSAQAMVSTKASLRLKYSRAECKMIATWLNNLPLDITACCQAMHPKRAMWVRFIRALRLAEYSQKAPFGKLNALLDMFYNQGYEVLAGRVETYRLKLDADNTFGLLKQRPGLFARSLFANMLWFGPEATCAAFEEVVDQVPARLVFTLQMYAEYYFDRHQKRSVKPLGGVNKLISANPLLANYDDKQLADMLVLIDNLCLAAIQKRFAALPNTNSSIYIDPLLFKIPMSIGDRGETVQDRSAALAGTRFGVDGDEVRLFMQWGNGMPAQHLDMDLSCFVTYEKQTEVCSFSNLTATGCMHSGDIRSIPNYIGTAEYIAINLPVLAKAGAKYVVFTCNAYSNGSISPNLVLGWMDSRFPMSISENSGVAYDPSCVQHQVRITQSLAKGMVFGVLDVAAKEIIWLEMAFQGQLVRQMDYKNVVSLLKKLEAKITIGQLLQIKASAQNLQMVSTPDADEIYDIKWSENTAAVTQLLID